LLPIVVPLPALAAQIALGGWRCGCCVARQS